LKKFNLIALVWTFMVFSISHANAQLPYSVSSVGIKGSNLVRLFGPGQIDVNGSSKKFTGYYIINVDSIIAIHNANDAIPDSGCMMEVELGSEVKSVSILRQSCQGVIEHVVKARLMANNTVSIFNK
jgi:hypothetical protein